MTAINHKTSVIIEMIRDSYHMTRNNLTQTIKIVMNYHSENTEIKNVTEIKIISVTNQKVITINYQTVQRIETINIRNNISFLKLNSMIKRIFSRHIM